MCLAIPGQIVHIDASADPALRMATVNFSGIRKSISLSLTPEAGLGDYVLVHVGFALTVVSEEEAHKTLAFLSTVSGDDEIARELTAGDEERS